LITEQLAYGCTGIQTSMLANTLAGTPVLLAGNERRRRSTSAC
jgi:acyl-CoA dehydrogenase